MNDKMGYRHIPHAFFLFITFLSFALPVRSVPTFIELLVGAIITQAGFVTQAWLAINMKRHWTSYYKWLQQGKWSWVKLGRQMAKLIITFFPNKQRFLVIDDTIIYRSSKKAPGSKFHHEHGAKANRPRCVRGQSWVALASVVNKGLSFAAIPLLFRMMKVNGNTSKLHAAKVLIRTILPVFTPEKLCLLIDSWYMRATLVLYALKNGLHVIGQVRKDTALYDIPNRTGKRGRPRKYGDKLTPERIKLLHYKKEHHFIYGKWQWVYYKSIIAKARFLKGEQVKAVWVYFEDENGSTTNERLILATNITLSPWEIVSAYAKRWSIETMFAQIKNNWGWKDAWQQSRQVLHRWTQILSLGYAIPQLLVLFAGSQIQKLSFLTPWRSKKSVTAGQVRLWLKMILSHVRVRDWWNPKSRKFQPPYPLDSAWKLHDL